MGLIPELTREQQACPHVDVFLNRSKVPTCRKCRLEWPDDHARIQRDQVDAAKWRTLGHFTTSATTPVPESEEKPKPRRYRRTEE